MIRVCYTFRITTSILLVGLNLEGNSLVSMFPSVSSPTGITFQFSQLRILCVLSFYNNPSPHISFLSSYIQLH